MSSQSRLSPDYPAIVRQLFPDRTFNQILNRLRPHVLPVEVLVRAVPEGASILDVMNHIPPDAQLTILDMATEKASPGGRILYKDMSNRPMWMAYANRLHDLMIAREWIHYLPLDKVKERLEQKGFRKLSSERITRYYYMHEILVMEREMT